MAQRDLTLPDLPGEPHHPVSFSFPKRTFGQKKIVSRSFQHTWYTSWPWLHYDEEKDIVFCHICVLALKQKKTRLTAGNSEGAFISRGFSNWKDATISFRKHDSSSCHKEAFEKMITLPATTRDIGEVLSSIQSSEKAENRKCMLKILSNGRVVQLEGVVTMRPTVTSTSCTNFAAKTTELLNNG